MGDNHHHHHGPGHHHHHGDTKNISFAFFLNLGFTVIEVIGGLMTNSIAILSDALHDLGDSLALGLAWYFEKVSRKGSDKDYSYGYRRFSLLGAIINSTVLVVGSFFILQHAIPRLINPVQPETKGMIGLAILGVCVNGLAVLKLRGGTSLNQRVMALHLVEDVLGWVAVLISAIIMNFYDIPILDPLLSMAIAAYILFNAVKSLRHGAKIVLQGTPDKIDFEEIKANLVTIDHVDEVFDLHIWSLDGEYMIGTVHLIVDDEANFQDLLDAKKSVREQLKEKNVTHVTIEFDTREMAPQEMIDHGI